MFLELLEKFLKNKEILWKYIKSKVKFVKVVDIKVDILLIYLLEGY